MPKAPSSKTFKFGSEATQLDIKISDPITKLLNSEPKVLVPQRDGTYDVSLRYVTKVPLLYIRRTAGSATIAQRDECIVALRSRPSTNAIARCAKNLFLLNNFA